MSRKQKRTLLRIIIAAVVFAVGVALGFVFPESEERFKPMWFVRTAALVAAYLAAGYAD